MTITAARDVRFQSASQRSPTNALNAVEAGAAEFTLNDLPPLPTPDRQSDGCDDCAGLQVDAHSAVVLMLIACLPACRTLSATIRSCVKQSVGARQFPGCMRHRDTRSLVALYIEAFFAILCLLGIMWGDPGVLKALAGDVLPAAAEYRREAATEAVARGPRECLRGPARLLRALLHLAPGLVAAALSRQHPPLQHLPALRGRL